MAAWFVSHCHTVGGREMCVEGPFGVFYIPLVMFNIMCIVIFISVRSFLIRVVPLSNLVQYIIRFFCSHLILV